MTTITSNPLILFKPTSCLAIGKNTHFSVSGIINPKLRKWEIGAAKKNTKKEREDYHSHVAKPDESTGPYPESVLLKEKKVQEDGRLLPEFADDEEQDLFELLSLKLESGLDVNQMRHYEVVYLIHEDREEEVATVNTKVEEFIKEKKGRIYRFSDWGLRRLAYKIQKARNAHYILMNFEIAANYINDFKTMLDKDERVIRHLVMKRDKAETEYCPPPPEFHSSYAGTDSEDEDEEDEFEDEDGNYLDNEDGVIYVDDFIKNESDIEAQKGKKPEKVGR